MPSRTIQKTLLNASIDNQFSSRYRVYNARHEDCTFRAFGQLAQLDRAMASGAIGRAFESPIAHNAGYDTKKPPDEGRSCTASSTEYRKLRDSRVRRHIDGDGLARGHGYRLTPDGRPGLPGSGVGLRGKYEVLRLNEIEKVLIKVLDAE